MVGEKELLEKIGFTPGEARCYLSLLSIGESTVGPIAKESYISMSKIYSVLNGLIKKGLVSTIIKNKTRHFIPADPERILEIIKENKREIEKNEKALSKLLPILKSRLEIGRKERAAELFEGFKGIKTFYEQILKEGSAGETIYALGIPKYAAEEYEGYFLDWNKRRVKKKIYLKVLYNFDAKEAAKKRKCLPLTDIRYLPKEIITPSWAIIYKAIVATIHLIRKPLCLVIYDETTATSYKSYFELLWKNSMRS